MMPLAIFRVDASEAIGTGHVMRCLTLATALRERGTNILFVCRMHAGNLCTLIEDRGFQVSRLPLSGTIKTTADALAHAHWLGSSWEEDAAQTRAAVDALGVRPDWLVVDHYALDHRWEDALRGCVGRILVIDDLADRKHDCDLLLDQNMVRGMSSRYGNLLPPKTRQMLGPEFALLQPAYAGFHQNAVVRKGRVRSLFVYFGGVDQYGMTAKVLEAVASLSRVDVQIDTVLPRLGQDGFSLQERFPSGNVSWHRDVPTLAPLLAKADLAIGAGGATNWERICVGLPSVIISIADNQVAVAEELQRQGLVKYLGRQEEVTVSGIAAELERQFASESNEECSRRCLVTVDGKGAGRVAAAMVIARHYSLFVRKVRRDDERLLLEWANDPVVRRNAFNTAAIDAAIHGKWLGSRLASMADCRMFIVESDGGVPVGQVRFELKSGEWQIDYSVAPDFRGKGLGRQVLESAAMVFAESVADAALVGEVKVENQASQKVFESLGFERQDVGGVVRYIRSARGLPK